MASPGLLFLLMASSSLLISVLSAPSSSKQLQTHALHKRADVIKGAMTSLLLSGLSAPSSSKQLQTHALHKRSDIKKSLVTAAAYSAKILAVTAPFMSIIPVYGTLIRAIVSLGSVGLEEIGGMGPDQTLAFIKSEFENLNIKIDQYHKEQKWDTWASAYAKYETKIDTKWDNFKDLVKVFGTKEKENEWKKKTEEFKRQYNPDSINEFANLLTKENAVFITDFGKLISEHVNCHEEDVKVLTQVINTLIYQGVTMSHFYYKLKEMNEVDKLADTAFKVSSTMFQIHKKCIIDSLDYVKEDVEKLIDTSDKSQQAKKIRVFLEKAYDRYDWTVVVFNTENSERSFKVLNSHFLSGFTEVKKGELTAAVARQVKGKHTKGRSVSEDIKNCVKDSDQCMDVIEKLEKCKAITNHYSAIHVFDAKNKRHDSIGETPNFYEGECGLIMKGGFIVFIKSDEEIEKKDPCSTMKCGDETKGKCVVLKDTLIPVCECKKPYYGENCEESLDEYKKKMNEELPQSQSTE